MCLLALGWLHHPRWRLVMAGNRDEFHARPTAALAPWQDETSVIGGRDLRSGGGWAGVGAGGRMAVVTNVRDPQAAQTGPSRGALVADYLRGRDPAGTHIERLAGISAAYAPFNLLLADGHSLEYLGNHPAERQTLGPGVHGMSNGAIDAPWPKTRRLMDALSAWLEQDGVRSRSQGEKGSDPTVERPGRRTSPGRQRPARYRHRHGARTLAQPRLHPWRRLRHPRQYRAAD